MTELHESDLIRGGHYNWKHQPERLKYAGQMGVWHQFELVGRQGIWCEVLGDDIRMLEKTQQAGKEG